MLIETFAVPLLTLILGVVSLAFDANDSHRHRGLLLGLIVLSFLGICGFEIVANINDSQEEQDNAELVARLEKKNDVLTQHLEDINTIIRQTDANVAMLVAQLQQEGVSDEVIAAVEQSLEADFSSIAALLIQLKQQGFSDDAIAAVEQSLAADEALRTELANRAWLDPTANPTTVQYLAKDVDADTVAVTLEELGFKAVAVDRESLETTTNTILFSSDTSLAQVKIVALTLTRAGVQIQSIRPLKTGRNRIQAEADATLGESCAVWSTEMIRAATIFDTNDGGCAPMSAEVAQQL